MRPWWSTAPGGRAASSARPRLRRLGLTNVRALKNGTMGWVLAGLELETKPATESAGCAVGEVGIKSRRRLQRKSPRKKKLRWISAQQFASALASMDDGVTYLIDVRSEDEFEAGHISGSINVPGGQAVQRADDFVAVRNAQIIFISSESARAVMAAYWYRQMGFRNVLVLQGGLRAWSESGATIGARGAIQTSHWVSKPRNRGQCLIDARDLPNANARVLRLWSSMSVRVSNSNRRTCRAPNGFPADGSSSNSGASIPDRGQADRRELRGWPAVGLRRARVGRIGYTGCLQFLPAACSAWRAAGFKTKQDAIAAWFSPMMSSCRRRFAAARKICSVIWIGNLKLERDRAAQQLSYFGLAKVLAVLRCDVEAQPWHIRQVFAVDVDFDCVAIGDVVHFMNIVVGRNQARNHSGSVF